LLPDSLEVYCGKIFLGNVSSLPLTNVSVYNNDTGEFLGEYITSSECPNNYSVGITVTEVVSLNDGKANTGDKLKFKVNGIDCVSPAPGSYSITAVPGGIPVIHENVNLIVPPTCNDRVKNGNETGVDCGNTCTPCYALNVTPSNIFQIARRNASYIDTIKLQNVGYRNLTGIKFNISSNNCEPNITLTFVPSNISNLNGSGSGVRSDGEIKIVNVNKSIGITSEGFYFCIVNINTNENISKNVNLSVYVSELNKFSIPLIKGWNLISIPLHQII